MGKRNMRWHTGKNNPILNHDILSFILFLKANHMKSNTKHSVGGHDACTGDSGGPLTCIRGLVRPFL